MSDATAGRPFVSVMIPTYESGSLLAETLESVLAQDLGPERMEIVVVDDHSVTDRPEAAIAAAGGGRVGLFRQPQNRGISANFSTCVARARGEWVHVLHGDDLVVEGFYEDLVRIAAEQPEAGAVVFGCDVIDGSSRFLEHAPPLRDRPGFLGESEIDGIFCRNPVRTPAVVIRRTVYDALGGYHPALRHCADWDMWKRVMSSTPTWVEPTVRARYRAHEASDTAAAYASGENLRDALRSVAIGRRYLPAPRTDRVRRAAYRELRAMASGLRRAVGDDVPLARRSAYTSLILRCAVGEASAAGAVALHRVRSRISRALRDGAGTSRSSG